MEIVNVDAQLYLRFGTENPFWIVTQDSNVIRLGGSRSALKASAASTLLPAESLESVRDLGDTLGKIPCSIRIDGKPIPAFLFGKRFPDDAWRGVLSTNPAYQASDSIVSELYVPRHSNVVSFPMCQRT
ncbi:hypothetical protein [Burkholderia ubonensis]|uniref:hypothetical protein n=1 Tax=Burkholderia ubonensis TaxID=101571 RepID=UPI0012FA9E86|nr:hypothetical protein [Burkholderia ubonensis]